MESERVWVSSLERKKHEISMLLQHLERKRQKKSRSSSIPIITLDEAIVHQDFESFQLAMRSIAMQFGNRSVSTLFEKYLYPSLDHVRYLSAGISSATQYEGAAALTWGILLIVIQCGCVFAENLEGILAQLAGLQAILPYLEMDYHMYPEHKAIELSLRTIFEDYIDFCLVMVRHLTKNPFLVFIRNFVSSSLRHSLSKHRAKLINDVADFDRAVTSAERSRGIKADDRILQVIAPLERKVSHVKFPVESVHIPENLDFIGRDAELEELHNRIVTTHKDAKPISSALHGIPGIGKTDTALKFTYKYRADFDAVFWVNADPSRETETLRTFGNIGRRLGLFDSDVILEPQMEIVLDWLQNEDKKWLLVFDNVVDWKSIARYWPLRSRKPSAIIATSHMDMPWADYQLDLEPFSDKLGAAFLLKQLGLDQLETNDPTSIIAGEISKELGGCPLYLTLAQGFMALSRCTPSDYLGIVREGSDLTLELKSNSTWRYGRAVSTTHDRILQELSDGAKDLLFMLAFMNPDEIREEFILVNHDFSDLAFLKNKSAYISYIAELGVGKLVRRDTDGIHYLLRIHRATQKAILSRLNHQLHDRNLSFNRVIRLVRENFPEPSKFAKLQIAEAHVWPLITKVLPHLLTAFNSFERSSPRMEGDMFFAQLLYDVAGMDLYDRGRISEAYKLNKAVGKILKSLDVPFESRLMADSLAIIGMCTDFMALSKRQEGLEIRERCVQIRERCFALIPAKDVTPEDKIWLYNSYTDLVCSQQQINDFEHARENLEKCFEHYKLWGGEDEIPYEYSKYYNQMAYVLLYENDSAKAVEFAKKGYELVEKATPGAQIAVLYKFDYANILFQHGDMKNALKALKETLKICKRDCGKDNVRTLEVRLNIGIVSYYLKDLDYAEKQIKKALEMKSQELWPVENFVRGKYYLSQVQKQRDPTLQSATDLETEAKAQLQELLVLDSLGKAKEYQDNFPMLFDYLVHWECRLITPRKALHLPISRGSAEGHVL